MKKRPPITAAVLFRDEPPQWGLRGDPFLWTEMAQRFANIPCPTTSSELVALVENEFDSLIGCSMAQSDSIFVERYSHRGMSSGHVSPEFWRDVALPLLIERFKGLHMNSNKCLEVKVRADRVRYIKLGREGQWEKECLENGIIRFGYGSATVERFPLCSAHKWDDLTKSFIAAGKDKGTATRFTNEARIFFDDDSSVLWITFVGERLCWGFLEPDPAERHQSGDGVFRKLKGGWSWCDFNGEQLTKDRLSGALTKLAAYRGTSCDVDVAEYVVRRINGQKTPEVERAIVALEELKRSVLGMIRLLGPKDFETLVDLVFSISGWRRQGIVGKTQKTLDLDLILPSTGERAFVQVKSKTNSAELADYVAKLDELDSYSRMFFVYHSGNAETDDERVIVIGPEKLAEMAVDAGLATWLVRKVS